MVAASSGASDFYALTKSASRALGAVAMDADMAKVVKPRVRRLRVEGDSLMPRRRQSAPPSFSNFVGSRSGCPMRADHRESAKVRDPNRFRHEVFGSEGDA